MMLRQIHRKSPSDDAEFSCLQGAPAIQRVPSFYSIDTAQGAHGNGQEIACDGLRTRDPGKL